MKPQKSASLRSLQSATTLGRKNHRGVGIAHFDFSKEITNLFDKFDQHGVYLCRNQQNDEYYKSLKAEKKSSGKQASMTTSVRVQPAGVEHRSKTLMDDVTGSPLRSGTSTLTQYTSHLYQLNTIYDSQDELVELLMSKTRHIPRVLMQCITVLSPHCRYLTKFSILKSRLNGYVLLELKRMLQLSNLTEIVLDGSVLTESDYAVLLEDGSKLRYLSLARCGVGDEECEKIASEIDCKVSAHSNIALLNLSSNQISDAGVKRLAQALRTNRSLRYLNLASNRISDDGAMPLLDVFMEFPLTYDEISAKQARYCVYIKEKASVLKQFYDDIDTGSSNDESSRKAEKSRKKPVSARDRAPLLGQIRVKFNDPFAPDHLKFKDDVVFCVGNIVLCYLNLSFNNLSYLSVKRLETVMVYQRDMKKPADFGLMKVVIEGNPLFENCAEYNTLSQMLVNSIFRFCPGQEGRRRSFMLKSPRK